MAVFGRETHVQLVYDSDQFQALAEEVRQLVGEANAATDRLILATKELEDARKEVEKTLNKLQVERRRPATRSTR